MRHRDDDLHVEFHSRQDSPQHTGAVRIHTCLLRVLDSARVWKFEHNLSALGDTLSKLTALQSVVLETSHYVNVDDVTLMLQSLRDTCRVEVQHRTCDDAHKLALQIKKSPFRTRGEGLLSPYWCLPGHAQFMWAIWYVLAALAS